MSKPFIHKKFFSKYQKEELVAAQEQREASKERMRELTKKTLEDVTALRKKADLGHVAVDTHNDAIFSTNTLTQERIHEAMAEMVKKSEDVMIWGNATPILEDSKPKGLSHDVRLDFLLDMINTFNAGKSSNRFTDIMLEINYPKPWPTYTSVSRIEYVDGKLELFIDDSEPESEGDNSYGSNSTRHGIQQPGYQESRPSSFSYSQPKQVGLHLYQQLSKGKSDSTSSSAPY